MWTVTLVASTRTFTVQVPYLGRWLEHAVYFRSPGFFAQVWEVTGADWDARTATAEYRGLRRCDPLYGAGKPLVDASRLLAKHPIPQ